MIDVNTAITKELCRACGVSGNRPDVADGGEAFDLLPSSSSYLMARYRITLVPPEGELLTLILCHSCADKLVRLLRDRN